MSMMPCIPYLSYLSYLSYIPYIPYIWNVITTPTIHTIANIHAIHTIPTLHRKYSIPIIATIHTIQTIHTVISNIPCPTDLHTIPTIHTIPTTHAIHTIPTIHTKHTILSKHAIPDRPYTPYIPNIPYHTPTTPQGGRGTVPHRHHTTGGEGEDFIWGQYMGPIPWGGRGGGRAWCIHIYTYTRHYLCLCVCRNRGFPWVPTSRSESCGKWRGCTTMTVQRVLRLALLVCHLKSFVQLRVGHACLGWQSYRKQKITPFKICWIDYFV